MPRWLLWSFVAVFCWGYWAVISKLIGKALTAAQSQALSTLGLIPVMIALATSRRLTVRGDRRRGIGAAIVAGALACAGNVAYYHALNVGGTVATLVSLTGLYPLVTITLAMLLLHERLNLFQIAGVGLSLFAIGLFNMTGFEEGVEIASGSLSYAFIPIALWGVAGLLQKISTNHISGELSTLWFLTAFVPVALTILFFQPVSGSVTLNTWFLVAALGLSFSLGNFAILAAFANEGKASIITPLTGLYPVVSVPVAIFFFGERIADREKAGIALALVSVIALSYEKSPTPGPSTTSKI